MVAEDLHAWLCVWVVGRLEAEFGYAWKGRTQLLMHLKKNGLRKILLISAKGCRNLICASM